MALEKIAFLPFGKLIDKWRWDVFSGKITPEKYNQALVGRCARSTRASRRRSRAPRTDFDPGAKYHVPGNTPYMRYFLARILQFQFHRALCEAPATRARSTSARSTATRKPARRLRRCWQLGASRSRGRRRSFELTGTRADGRHAILEYFAPLQAWLKEQNKGQTCGW